MTQMPYDKRDEDSGKFEPEYESRQFVKAVARADLATTSNIAEQVGCSRRTALKHLNKLEEEGRLSSTMAGRAKIWSRE